MDDADLPKERSSELAPHVDILDGTPLAQSCYFRHRTLKVCDTGRYPDWLRC